MGALSGKTAIITGASAGFGRGVAYAFAKEGANLVLTARREERLIEAAEKCKELGGNAVYYAGDAIEESSAIAVKELAVKTFGRIDILINNAGIGRCTSVTEATMEEYDLVMDSNVKSAFAFSKHVVPVMQQQHDGQIVMVSSVTGIYGRGHEAAYTASKFAIRGLGQSLLQDYLEDGIRTTVFCPHAGVTEFEIGFGREEESWSKTGFLTPEDVGHAILDICTQTSNCYIAELQLASNNVFYR